MRPTILAALFLAACGSDPNTPPETDAFTVDGSVDSLSPGVDAARPDSMPACTIQEGADCTSNGICCSDQSCRPRDTGSSVYTCQSCGTVGQGPCSTGLSCAPGYSVQGGTCQACGRQDEACCGASLNGCFDGFTCTNPGHNGATCTACGGLGQTCCAGVCADGLRCGTGLVCVQ